MLKGIKLTSEMRFVCFAAGLYTTFIYWGYLQEKLTSSTYLLPADGLQVTPTIAWNFPFVLNLSMSLTAAMTAFVADRGSSGRALSPLLFWRASATSALASPIGYASLRYVSYPMMILTKSSKPVPVMLIGLLFYKRVYRWYKYAGVALLCCGIALFTAAKTRGAANNQHDDHSLGQQLLGVALILVNLTLDGYTNNEQDHIFAAHGASPLQMMKFCNLWQAAYLLAYLLLGAVAHGGDSELSQGLRAVWASGAIRFDLLMFCLCASLGQVLISGLMKEFGSLAWITLSVTRQLFTVLLSVFIFQHAVNGAQWLGIALVFSGLGLEAAMVYFNKEQAPTSTSVLMSVATGGVDIGEGGEVVGAEDRRIRTDSVEDLERNSESSKERRKKKE